MQFVFIISTLFIFLGNAFWSEAIASSGDPVHWSAQKTKCDRQKSFCELKGEAALHQKGESLYADTISYNLKDRHVKARGHVLFVSETATIHATEMDYQLDDRTGTIHHGLVLNDAFSLSGEIITKLGEGHYKTTKGEYTTCRDCPKSWAIEADEVDLEIEGYAYMHGVVAKINDASAFWLPYLVVPIKTKRQSGFLMTRPSFVPTQGISLIQPYFWAISRSKDMTFGLGQIAGRGLRLEWEGRAQFKNGEFSSNTFYTRDKTFRKVIDDNRWDLNRQYTKDRWSLFIHQNQLLPFGVEEKFNFVDVSDSFYPSVLRHDFMVGDPNGQLVGAAFLPSTLSFSKSRENFSTSLKFKRYRNLLTQSDASNPVQDARIFDPNTVQVLPEVNLHLFPKSFFNDTFDFSVGANATKFSRSGRFYDKDSFDTTSPFTSNYVAGKDPIREATRISVEPSLSRSFRLLDTVEGTATTTFRQFFYKFNQPEIPSLQRNYLQFELDLLSQLEKVYTLSDPYTPRLKHLIRPTLKYSFIPYSHTPPHPFTDQILYANENKFTGYQFDNNDIVPLDSNFTNANYFAPEGNAITYGFNSSLIRKRITDLSDPENTSLISYARVMDWSVGQTFNFRELRTTSHQQPLSQVFSDLNVQLDRFSGFLNYRYVPYIPVNTARWSRHIVSGSVAYTLDRNSDIGLKSVEKRQNLFPIQRAVSLGYSHNRASEGAQTDQLSGGVVFSVNDYITPKSTASYSLITKKWLAVESSLTFRSPSQCWMVALTHLLQPYCPEEKNCSVFGFQWGINIDGGGYGAVQ